MAFEPKDGLADKPAQRMIGMPWWQFLISQGFL
jgi:hypothetical protein